MQRIILTFLVSLFPLASFAAPITQYSAFVTSTQGKESSGGKLFVDGSSVRVEAKVQGHESYTIVRPDLGRVYSILPSEKVYMEIPVSKEEANMMVPYPADTKMTPAGEETINGQTCIKYKLDDVDGNVYLWVNKKTQAPVLMTSLDSGIKTEWKDLKAGPQNSALFEVPAGYKKVDPAEQPKP